MSELHNPCKFYAFLLWKSACENCLQDRRSSHSGCGLHILGHLVVSHHIIFSFVIVKWNNNFPPLSLLIFRLSFFLTLLNTFFFLLASTISSCFSPPPCCSLVGVFADKKHTASQLSLAKYDMFSTFIASCTRDCWFTCLLSSTSVLLLQAQTIINQDKVVCNVIAFDYEC